MKIKKKKKKKKKKKNGEKEGEEENESWEKKGVVQRKESSPAEIGKWIEHLTVKVILLGKRLRIQRGNKRTFNSRESGY